jgi:DNA-binding response OmpR family regulator
MANILVVDDDHQVLRSIQHILEDAGYAVATTESGLEAIEWVKQERPDLLILDIIMPEISGTDVCRRLRADPYFARLPIIFLTAKGRPVDIASGLDIGADDYLVKPFEVIELPARVRALLRRAEGGTLDTQTTRIQVGDIQVMENDLCIRVGTQAVELTPIEHRLLLYLMRHAGQPVATDRLLMDVWEYPAGVGDPRLVRVHIVNLRNKIEADPADPQIIQNIRGRGYIFQN